MGLVIEIDELGQLATRLDASAKTITSRMILAARKSVADMERIAKQRVPVRTGNLKNSIHIEDSQSLTGMNVALVASANYAVFVEFGTSRMAPQPFMRPARDAVLPGYITAVGQLANPLNGPASAGPGWASAPGIVL